MLRVPVVALERMLDEARPTPREFEMRKVAQVELQRHQQHRFTNVVVHEREQMDQATSGSWSRPKALSVVEGGKGYFAVYGRRNDATARRGEFPTVPIGSPRADAPPPAHSERAFRPAHPRFWRIGWSGDINEELRAQRRAIATVDRFVADEVRRVMRDLRKQGSFRAELLALLDAFQTFNWWIDFGCDLAIAPRDEVHRRLSHLLCDYLISADASGQINLAEALRPSEAEVQSDAPATRRTDDDREDDQEDPHDHATIPEAGSESESKTESRAPPGGNGSGAALCGAWPPPPEGLGVGSQPHPAQQKRE